MIRLSHPLTLCLLLALSLPAPALAAPCQRGNPKNTAYMERTGDNRCEGITSPDIARPDFSVRSFVIGQFAVSNPLRLRLPKVAATPPTLRIQSSQKYYQLDPLTLKPTGNQWQFQWSDQVLRQENIPLSALRGLAESGSDRVLLPLLLSSPNAYKIHIYTGGRTKAMTLRILSPSGQTRYTTRLANRPGDEVTFSWKGTTNQGQPLPQGRYTLKVDATIEQLNAPPTTRSLTRQFQHNPAWLK